MDRNACFWTIAALGVVVALIVVGLVGTPHFRATRKETVCLHSEENASELQIKIHTGGVYGVTREQYVGLHDLQTYLITSAGWGTPDVKAYAEASENDPIQVGLCKNIRAHQ